MLVALEADSELDALETLGRQIGMHVAATKPDALDIDAVDPAALSRERAVLTEQARASGKPDPVIEKMIEGRIRKYYEEVVLLEQVWVHDGESRVRAVVSKAGGKLAGFDRFTLGEGCGKGAGRRLCGRSGCCCRREVRQGKQFFFEKKNQKTFAPCRRLLK